jgi:hypothetical protein
MVDYTSVVLINQQSDLREGCFNNLFQKQSDFEGAKDGFEGCKNEEDYSGDFSRSPIKTSP